MNINKFHITLVLFALGVFLAFRSEFAYASITILLGGALIDRSVTKSQKYFYIFVGVIGVSLGITAILLDYYRISY